MKGFGVQMDFENDLLSVIPAKVVNRPAKVSEGGHFLLNICDYRDVSDIPRRFKAEAPYWEIDDEEEDTTQRFRIDTKAQEDEIEDV